MSCQFLQHVSPDIVLLEMKNHLPQTLCDFYSITTENQEKTDDFETEIIHLTERLIYALFNTLGFRMSAIGQNNPSGF